MEKITLTVEADDMDELKGLVNYKAAHMALWEISQEIFRPARKHGYSDNRLNTLLESTRPMKEDGEEFPSGYEVVSKLEEKFYEILSEYDIKLGEY
jgi:hypothetical protein